MGSAGPENVWHIYDAYKKVNGTRTTVSNFSISILCVFVCACMCVLLSKCPLELCVFMRTVQTSNRRGIKTYTYRIHF